MKILLYVFGVIFFGAAQTAFATAQVADILLYDGQKFPLFSNPLESYYNKDNPRPSFDVPSTANWRGYVATWEIAEGVLYLKEIQARVAGTNVGLTQLFPGHKEKVKATWFTGQLRVPRGKRLQYVHGGYASKYEQNWLITIQAGKIVKEEIVDNTNERANE